MSSRPFHPCLCASAWLALLALGVSAPLRAQSLRLRVREATTGRPVSGGIAEVLDASGAVAAQGVLTEDGARLLVLPAAGSYRVRIRRIGFEPFLGEAVSVTGRGVVDLALAVPDRRVRLSEIVVTARPRCSRDAFRDASVAALWEAVRTALTTTVLSRADSTLTLEKRSFRRTLDNDLTITGEWVGLPRLTSGGRPYVSRDAEDLAKEGYVRVEGEETVFYAPDEQVLLSDRFLDDHCFQVARGEGTADGLFGLHFTPSNRSHLNDIAGTLWVDSASAELRYLDFWYVHESMPLPVLGENRSGGQVVFQRLGSGLWLVPAWRLRMPHFAANRRVTKLSSPDWYEEFGGVVTPLPNDTVPPSAILEPYRALIAPSRMTGMVYDSLAGRPLAGARVWLLPEEPAAVVAEGLAPIGGRLIVEPIANVADATGSFSLHGVPPGTYRLTFEAPELDSLGIRAPQYDIRLRPGVSVVGKLTVPSLATLRSGCAMPAGADDVASGGMVTGLVRAAGDDRPLVGALVQGTWIDLRRYASLATKVTPTVVETRTDSLGEYRICGVADGAIATVRAAGPHSSTGGVQTQVGSLGIARVNLRLAEVAAGEIAPPSGTLTGTVADSLGVPVRDAEVTLDGAMVATRTDAGGHFRLTPIQPGTQSVEVKRVGLEPARLAVDIRPDSTTAVALTLVRTHLLDPLLITARRSGASQAEVDAVRRHRTGAGVLLTEEQIRGVPDVQSLLRGISGVRTALGQGGVSMQWVALMRKGGGECEARVFIDGREAGSDELLSLGTDQIAAMEVFVRAASAPMFTAGRSIFGRDDSCGSIIFWLKH